MLGLGQAGSPAVRSRQSGGSALNIGVGLPNTIPGTEPDLIGEWARRTEDGPFTSVGVLDRVRYDSLDPMASLAAVAPTTSRVRLVTMVVVGPLRNTTLLAKEAATIDALSGGRLTLGLAVGARLEDYEAAGIDPRGRGRRFAEQLAALRDAWEDPDVGPRPPQEGGPEVLVGGASDPAFARVARYADGYVHGGGPPRAFERAAQRVRSAWRDAGRPGEPRLWGQSYFALGDGAVDRGRAYMLDYYAFTGPFAERIAEGLLTSPQDVVQQIRGYAEAGCHELVLIPTVADPEQVDRLAEVVAGAS